MSLGLFLNGEGRDYNGLPWNFGIQVGDTLGRDALVSYRFISVNIYWTTMV